MPQLTLKPGLNQLDASSYDLAPGDIPIGATIQTVPGTIVKCARGKDGYGPAYRGDGLTIKGGGEFHGAGLFLDKNGGRNANITIDNILWRLDTAGQFNSCISFTSGLVNSRITNNGFTGYSTGGWGIFGYNYKGLVIANNEFIDISAAMHIDAQGNDNNANGDLLVEQNYMKGTKGMGMEFQGAGSNLVFQDNWFEHPNLQPYIQPGNKENPANSNSMAFSLILDKSKNIRIRRNYLFAPERPDGTGCRIGFELGGDDAIVENNCADWINHVAAVNDGVGTCSVIVRNNRFSNYRQGPSISYAAANRTAAFSNNGPGVALVDWDPSRGRPYRNKRYGAAAPAPTPPAVDVAALQAQLASSQALAAKLQGKIDKITPASAAIAAALTN